MRLAPIALLTVFMLGPTQASLHVQPAVPVDPITAIVEAFTTHQIVALAEGAHNNEQGHAFRLALIRDPRFVQNVDDIVVECGNARYQELVDRFVRGEDVRYASLRQVWENTAVANTVWDKPIYEEFFRAVRTVNAAAPKGHQLRIVLGDPPIDWNTVETEKDPAALVDQTRQLPG